ncbi:hypothetical protein ACWER6_31020 [Streptomyces sp. NPDC004009]
MTGGSQVWGSEGEAADRDCGRVVVEVAVDVGEQVVVEGVQQFVGVVLGPGGRSFSERVEPAVGVASFDDAVRVEEEQVADLERERLDVVGGDAEGAAESDRKMARLRRERGDVRSAQEERWWVAAVDQVDDRYRARRRLSGLRQ